MVCGVHRIGNSIHCVSLSDGGSMNWLLFIKVICVIVAVLCWVLVIAVIVKPGKTTNADSVTGLICFPLGTITTALAFAIES